MSYAISKKKDYFRKIILFLSLIVYVQGFTFGRSVNIFVNNNTHTIGIVELYINKNDKLDTTYYEYIFPEELKIFLIDKKDTQCVFISPCVSEYNYIENQQLKIFLWPSRIICPDDCVCMMEDSGFGCYRYLDDADLCLDIEYTGYDFVFTITPKVNLLDYSSRYSISLVAETEGQKKNGTVLSALYWIKVYETIVNNSIIFYLFSQDSLKLKDIITLSAHLKYFDASL